MDVNGTREHIPLRMTMTETTDPYSRPAKHRVLHGSDLTSTARPLLKPNFLFSVVVLPLLTATYHVGVTAFKLLARGRRTVHVG